MRNKQYLTAVRPLDGALAMSTMRFADEVVPRADVDDVPTSRAKPDAEGDAMADPAHRRAHRDVEARSATTTPTPRSCAADQGQGHRRGGRATSQPSRGAQGARPDGGARSQRRGARPDAASKDAGHAEDVHARGRARAPDNWPHGHRGPTKQAQRAEQGDGKAAPGTYKPAIAVTALSAAPRQPAALPEGQTHQGRSGSADQQLCAGLRAALGYGFRSDGTSRFSSRWVSEDGLELAQLARRVARPGCDALRGRP